LTTARLPGFWEDRLLSFFLAFLVLMTIVVPMLGLSALRMVNQNIDIRFLSNCAPHGWHAAWLGYGRTCFFQPTEPHLCECP